VVCTLADRSSLHVSTINTLLDEEFDVLGEDELALLTRRFERLHEN
jgi:hypothetical protein